MPRIDDEQVKKEKEKPKLRFVIDEIPTQTRPVILDTKKNQVYDELVMLCRIANILEELKTKK